MSQYTDDIRNAVECLRKGGVILYPTDTVWGIGCDATDSMSVRRIFEIKRRADAKALITLVGSLAQLERTVEDVPEVAYQLIEYSEKPLTIVYDGPMASARIAPELLADDGTIGVRVTSEAFSSELCKAFGKPIVSTSANISGQPSPAVYSEITPEIITAVDYVCLSRRSESPGAGIRPSSVIRLSAGGLFKIIRD
ncbi:MAG: threonylcarbamoyl-AMP synthase [Muribaculaceae bacterium]|nr:threonylcarbamoyl-AMP synthase [Muribaculaceae bacterium]MDE6134040.1 threonylcarbamoyl-AMP synthase [Muribaculaceae bacterium]